MNPRDRHAYRQCLDCTRLVLPPRRKCNHCRKAKTTVTVLRPSRKGYNARGTALHRPTKSHTRRAKRQNTASLGMTPQLRSSGF